MFKLWRNVFTAFFLICLFFLFSKDSSAVTSCTNDDPCKDIGDVYSKVSCYTDLVNVCANQRESMAAQITYLNTRIQLTTVKIDSAKNKIVTLEREIDEITNKIDGLEKSLTDIISNLIDRIKATYKRGEMPLLSLMVTSQRFSDFFNKYKYMQTVQAHDRRILFQLQNSKVNFEDQKKLREEKRQELELTKKQLEKEQATLAVQKKEKEIFLEITKNNESIYKQNLNAARQESEAITRVASILAKAGIPQRVSKGEVIGVMGNTGFSTGPHLHFSVYSLKESEFNRFNFNYGYENPFDYLKSRSLLFYPKYSCNDMINETSIKTKTVGSGSWDWPMANPRITQCFGQTPYSVGVYPSQIHNGVDMIDDFDPRVKAVDDGQAYFCKRCDSYGANGVFIFHPNGKMSLYWHLQ